MINGWRGPVNKRAQGGMMKKSIFLSICLLPLLGGCVWRMFQTPAVESAAAEAVEIVSEPPQGCQFIAGIMGDENGGDPGHFIWEKSVADTVSVHLKNNAARLGGNVVFLRRAYMGKPDRSTDSYNPFYINDVQYDGLVYKCP